MSLQSCAVSAHQIASGIYICIQRVLPYKVTDAQNSEVAYLGQ